jgi:TfoX/Sxy family transcriptional regulator of competence genes
MKVNSEKQNYFKADLAKIRYLNAKIMLKFAVDELEKTINIAKYLKVQERLL